jgi:hypothetical protein
MVATKRKLDDTQKLVSKVPDTEKVLHWELEGTLSLSLSLRLKNIPTQKVLLED